MKKVKNMNIKKRLIISFLFTVFLASIASILALVMIIRVDARYSKALNLNGFIQGDLGEYNTYLVNESCSHYRSASGRFCFPNAMPDSRSDASGTR